MTLQIDSKRKKDLLSKLRKARPMFRGGDFCELISSLRSEGEHFSVAELIFLQDQASERVYSSTLPLIVAQFMALLTEKLPGSRILDPFGGLGLLGALIAESLSERIISVATPLFREARQLVEPLNLKNLSIGKNDNELPVSSTADAYDIIISNPPAGGITEKVSCTIGNRTIELEDDPSLVRIAKLVPNISDRGSIAIILVSKFFWNKNPGSLRQNLRAFGLSVSALLKFRPGTFETATRYLAVIDRRPREDMYVAEIPDDVDSQKALLERYIKRVQGKVPSLGRLVHHDKYFGLDTLEARERFQKIGRSRRLEAVDFRKAVREVKKTRRSCSDFQRFETHQDAVYLPEMASTNATTDQESLPEKLKSYLQLLVDTTIVLPAYLAEYLNSQMGITFRKSVMPEASIPRIKVELLKQSKLYLPTIDKQKQTMQALQEIRRIRTELSELESSLWDKPAKTNDVINALETLNHEERFSDWYEALPYPLAPILRLYQASEGTSKDKYEILLKFFEAFLIFCTTVHISALHRNSALWEKDRERISQILRRQGHTLRESTFGSWKLIFEYLTSTMTGMLESNDQRTTVFELYATPDDGPLEMLADRELTLIMQRTNNYRNRWTGHGGAVILREADERLELIQEELQKLRTIIGRGFLQYRLIQTGHAEVLDDSYRYQVKLLMGSNPLFETERIDLSDRVKTGSLCLYSPGHSKALPLIPFITIHGIEQPACYFYNRVDHNTYWVSYHLAPKSEISIEDKTLLSFLEEMESDESSQEEVEK